MVKLLKLSIQFFADPVPAEPAPAEPAPAEPDTMAALTAHFQTRISELEKAVADRDATIALILGGKQAGAQTEHNAGYDNSGFMNKLRL